MRSFILASALSLLSLVSTASATTFQGNGVTHARYSLPACDSAQISIFNGPTFDGVVYLHETDVQLSAKQTAAVRAIALQGTPAICQDAGTIVVTLASR